MSSEKLTKLETFIERHRPDFDPHEPGPDLWARLEQQLGQPGPGVGPVLLSEPAQREAAADFAAEAALRPVAVAMPAVAPVASQPADRAAPRQPWARYGVAAALAALVMAVVFSEAPRPAPRANLSVAPTPPETPNAPAPADAAYLGPAPAALAAEGRLGLPDPRLSAAVRGMEAYYATQLDARQAELRQLDGGESPAADWPRELASLDSSYRQLREELPHHPQPAVVLTAMNRNLQIRLDILDQQLAHRAPGPDPAAQASGTMVSLADSRAQP